MDSLEKFITKNREDLDTAVPDLKVWAHIDKELEKINTPLSAPAKVVSMRQRFKVAAAVLILVLAGGLGGEALMNTSSTEIASLSEIAPQYADTERYYTEQVEQKTQQLAAYQEDVMVDTDLQQLDEIYQELIKELKNAPKGSEEFIIQAMIKNYQTKIDILEHVIEKMEETNPSIKTTGNEISI